MNWKAAAKDFRDRFYARKKLCAKKIEELNDLKREHQLLWERWNHVVHDRERLRDERNQLLAQIAPAHRSSAELELKHLDSIYASAGSHPPEVENQDAPTVRCTFCGKQMYKPIGVHDVSINPYQTIYGCSECRASLPI